MKKGDLYYKSLDNRFLSSIHLTDLPRRRAIVAQSSQNKMTPNTAAKKRTSAKDDDFVLTLSDDENPPVDGEDGEEQQEDNNNDATMSGSGANKKRKREATANAVETTSTKEKEGKNKKQKQEALTNGKDNKKNKKGKKGAEPEPEFESEEEEEDEADAGEDDGALNPDFAFDFGATANQGVVEGFDGWGIGDGDGDNKDAAKNGNKKGVDIDEIISRRQALKEAESQKKEKKAKKQKSEDEQMVDGEEEGEDGESDGGMSVDFKDDELLAADGFGMGADGEDESGQSEQEAGSNESGEDENEAEKGDDDDDDEPASDNDSVATPIGHPDDDGPGDDSDAGSDKDAEEQEKRKAFFAPEEKTQEQSNAEMSKRSFQEFNLSRPILRGVAAVGFTNPTPIQRKTIPVALLGKDIVGSAVTGSGKTAAFVVPIIERLLFRPRKVPTSRVAILMPTRELAVQCYNVATKLATYTDITFCQLVGGFSLREQENVLKRRPDVIIATPGRFIDHMRNSASFTVDTLEILVLDEADRMLEDGFADELNEILTTIPKSRQTMLFSATMTDTVDKLIRVGLNRPVRLMVDSKKNTSGTLVQEFVRLRPGREGKRLGYLLHLCKEIYTGRVIIFFRQKREAHRIRTVFGLLGLKAAELHGSMSQEQVCCFLLLISHGYDH